MAINTQSRRRSAQYGTPGGQIRPVADGTVGTPDRAHCAWLYAGLTYDSPSADTESPQFRKLLVWMRRRAA